MLRQDNTNIKLYIWHNSYSFSLSPTLGEWFHLALTRQSGQLKYLLMNADRRYNRLHK
jgi:hypothetical protein